MTNKIALIKSVKRKSSDKRTVDSYERPVERTRSNSYGFTIYISKLYTLNSNLIIIWQNYHAHNTSCNTNRNFSNMRLDVNPRFKKKNDVSDHVQSRTVKSFNSYPICLTELLDCSVIYTHPLAGHSRWHDGTRWNFAEMNAALRTFPV